MNIDFSTDLVHGLLAWYDTCRRDLPWRHTLDPYRIWISEIMLQQTRVEAVKPYYERFLKACPTVRDLADIPEEQLLKLWEGLGYYSRARNLQKAARIVAEQYNGQMPASYEALRALPGIGDYTAGAIASIAFGVRVPAVDGNVLRVLARFGAVREPITDPKTKAAFREALLPLIPERAGDFNQALIELGATVCGPNGEAQCHACPLRTACMAYAQELTHVLPVRAAKRPRRIEERTVLIIRDENRTALCKRPDRGLLAGLYELPNLPGHADEQGLVQALRDMGFEPLRLERVEDSKHIFTHIEWHMIAYTVRIAPEFDGTCGLPGLSLIDNEDLHAHYAIPSAFAAYMKYL